MPDRSVNCTTWSASKEVVYTPPQCGHGARQVSELHHLISAQDGILHHSAGVVPDMFSEGIIWSESTCYLRVLEAVVF
jgi:hypothetical protein